MWPNDPDSYAGGSVAAGRASHAGRVEGDDPEKKVILWPYRLAVGIEANILTSEQNLILEKRNTIMDAGWILVVKDQGNVIRPRFLYFSVEYTQSV